MTPVEITRHAISRRSGNWVESFLSDVLTPEFYTEQPVPAQDQAGLPRRLHTLAHVLPTLHHEQYSTNEAWDIQSHYTHDNLPDRQTLRPCPKLVVGDAVDVLVQLVFVPGQKTQRNRQNDAYATGRPQRDIHAIGHG